ncbi:MAG: DUF3300 domain-containing protein, partial [Burkholderiales bacterium]|nr:DUF3300 domain-containing protein [Burkholderiales bacterium]
MSAPWSADFLPMLPHASRLFIALLVLLALAAVPARAQAPKPFTQAELDQMLAPIALFPDALLAQALMAATYPADVALAVDWAFAHRQLEGDAAVKAVQDQPWDPSVQSLVAFPKVLAMFGENPRWVQDLGDAFLDQPQDVMDSVQFLRAKAKDAGNLATNAQQVVTVEPAPPPPTTVVVNAPPPPAQIITIAPANPQVIFVPIYNPVWAFGPWWHPAFPPFFFPPPPRWGWGWSSAAHAGFWWGVGVGVSYALWGGVNWRTHNVNINVNHWNNINVNRRIDSRDRNVDWRHEARNRRGVPYRDASTRERNLPQLGDARSREGYRGRDVDRDRARAELESRVGAGNLDRDALRDVDRSIQPQRPGTGNVAGSARDRVANVDRPQIQDRAGTIDRSQIQDRAGSVDRSQIPNRAPAVDRSQVQNRAAGIDRSQIPSRPPPQASRAD